MRWLLLLALLGGCLTAPNPPYGFRYEWKQLSTGTGGPGPMHGAKLTWDDNRGAIVMYAGRNIDTQVPSGQVWMWKDQQWKEICNTGDVGAGTRPGAVYLPAFTYVKDTTDLVLVGGARIMQGEPQIFGNVSDEVWTCNKDDVWTKAGTIKNARLGASLVYLPDPQQLALVGGRNATNSIENVELGSKKADNFAVDPNPMDFPSEGTGQSATYDSTSHHILALETELTPDDSITPHDAIWTYDGTGWQRYCDGCSGIGRSDASIVHVDASLETYVLGGYIGSGNNVSGTWILDAGKLVKVDSQIADRNAMGVASTSGLTANKLLAFGGTGTNCNGSECDQTYEYRAAQ